MNSLIRKSALLMLLVLFVLPLACEKGLDVTDPNNPTPEIVMSEEGLKRQAIGLWDAGGGWWEWVIWQIHEHMGDNVVAPWANFDFNQFHGNIELIEYSDGSPDWSPREQSSSGRSQAEWLDFINDRQTSAEGYEQEWQVSYRFNNEANRILSVLDEGADLGTNAAQKESAYRAWAHFWKGYAYSRVGLYYDQGVIVDEPDATNNNFVASAEMIAESQRQLDLALQTASDLNVIASDVMPAIFPTNVTAASFEQNIYTLKARNLIASKAQGDLTPAEWQQILDWAELGLMTNDGALLYDSDEATHLASITFRYRLPLGWSRVSPRVVQILVESGDDRASRFTEVPPGDSFTNRVTQPQINTPWVTLTGTPYASTNPGTPQFVLSAEENKLMLAEAELMLGDPVAAAGWIDDVRSMPLQGAGLAPLGSATLQDIRNERKVALFGRALAFYDARRYGELAARADGGGVQDVWVYHLDNTGTLVLDPDANLYFDFVHYLEVPAHETDFNSPPGDTAPTD